MDFKDLIEKKPPSTKSMKDMPLSSVKPSIYVNASEIPEIKDWNLGDTYVFRARMTSRTSSEKEGPEDSTGNACFEVESWAPDTETPAKKDAKKPAAPPKDDGADAAMSDL